MKKREKQTMFNFLHFDATLIRLIGKKILSISFYLAWVTMSVSLFTGCNKETEEPSFKKALNKKWVPVSQMASPSWVFPATGQSYTDLVDFAKVYVPCLIDDAIEFIDDGSINNGIIDHYNGAVKCDPSQPDKDPRPGSEKQGRFWFDDATDSLLFINIPISETKTGNLPSKILELTNDRLVIRYFQEELPITKTSHTITETYKWIQ